LKQLHAKLLENQGAVDYDEKPYLYHIIFDMDVPFEAHWGIHLCILEQLEQ
jgi:hypothetical protein